MGQIELSTSGKGMQPTLPGMSELDLARARFKERQGALSANLEHQLKTFDGLNTVQQHVLDMYDRDVLKPQRSQWELMRTLLRRGPYTSFVQKHWTLGWRFDDTNLTPLPDGSVAHESTNVYAFLRNDTPHELSSLAKRLGRDQFSEKDLLEARDILGLPHVRLRGLKTGYLWKTDQPPSPQQIHQELGDQLLDYVAQFDVRVTATVAGKEEQIAFTSLTANELERPSEITCEFYVDRGFGGRFERITLSESSVMRFLEAWKFSPTLPGDEPDLENLIKFLKKQKQLNWDPYNFKLFNDIVGNILDTQLVTTSGSPQRQR